MSLRAGLFRAAEVCLPRCSSPRPRPRRNFEAALAGRGTAPAFSGSQSGPTPLGSPMLEPRHGGTHSRKSGWRRLFNTARPTEPAHAERAVMAAACWVAAVVLTVLRLTGAVHWSHCRSSAS